MGNGRRSRNSPGSSWVGGRILGPALALVAAGWVLLGLNASHSGQIARVQVPDSPMSASMSAALRGTLNPKPDLHQVLGRLPLIFEPNQGQAAAGVRFLAHGVGYGLFLDSAGAVLAVPTAPAPHAGLRAASIRMKLVNPNPHAALTGTGPLPGHSNYFLGNDPRKWLSNIPQFSGVRYENIYPGIDLVFYGNKGQLEYDFHVAPGADPARAEMEFDGATRLQLDHGDLVLDRGAEGRVLFRAPHIYQRFPDRESDREQLVSGGFVLRSASRAGFEIGAYDHSRELIIDPLPEIETYFGGNGTDTFPSIAVDPSGDFLYLASTTTSATTSFPGGLVPTQIGPGSHVFVAKIVPSQPPAVSYITFLGGTAADTATGVAVDGSGNAYLVGNTTSTDFPTTGTTAYQTTPRPKTLTCPITTLTCHSIFVSVLNSTGTGLNYSSYVSGTGDDVSTGMTIDANANVFLTGSTTSNDQPSISDVFPATEAPPAAQTAYQTFPLAPLQFFVTKVNTASAGNASIAYSTYFGGGTPTNATAVGGGIAVDSIGNIYFSGTTNFIFTGSGRPPDFPILNAYQPCLDTPPSTTITNPITCPTTSSTNTDAFLAKLNPNTSGQQLLFSTYIGGSGTDSSTALAIDSGAANIYLTGTTNSTDFIVPTGAGAFQSTNTCGTCAYVARFNNPTSTGTTQTNVGLTYFSYLGGQVLNDGVTNGLAVSVDTASGALLTGSTTSPTLLVTPNPGALQSTLNGPQNAFFARIDTTTVTGQNELGSYLTYFGGNGTDRGTSVTIDRNTNTYFAGDTTSNNLSTADALQSTLNGAQNDFFVKLGTAADLSLTTVPPTISPSSGVVNAGNDVTATFTVINNGPDLATNIIVSGSAFPANNITFKSASATSGTCTSQVTNGGLACTINTLQPGSSATITYVVVPSVGGTGYQVSATVSSIFNNDPNPNNNTAQAPSFQAAGFTVSATPTSHPAIDAGQSAIYSVTLNPSPVYSTAITLSSSGAPAATTSTFNPSTLTPNATPVGATLTVSTTARLQPIAGLRFRGARFYALWLAMPGLALIGLGTGSKRRRKCVLGALLLGALFALVLLQPACKSGTTTTPSSGTPAGTYTLTITATSGSLTETTTVNLTVQ
jgi:Domain of unknown function DUF11/Beta-propeller repeat